MIRKANTTLLRLTQLLNDGQIQDGNSLGSALGVTRSAVWKAIKKLQQYGVSIESIPGEGYQLKEPLILLDTQKIEKSLTTTCCVNVFESLPSTNQYLETMQRDKNIHLCLAEQQTAGKGRWGREWYSPFGRNIYFSCLYPWPKEVGELAGLSLVVSLSTLKTLSAFCDTTALKVKWPNDVMCSGKKISGALLQVQAESHGECHLIIGVGVNINMSDDEQVIAQAWTSLQKVTGRVIDRNDFAIMLANQLLSDLALFREHGFSYFKESWRLHDYLLGQIIALKNLNQTVEGVVVGVDAKGYLQLQLADQSIRSFASGDASIEKSSLK